MAPRDSRIYRVVGQDVAEALDLKPGDRYQVRRDRLSPNHLLVVKVEEETERDGQ